MIVTKETEVEEVEEEAIIIIIEEIEMKEVEEEAIMIILLKHHQSKSPFGGRSASSPYES
jgi:hypothetical protein